MVTNFAKIWFVGHITDRESGAWRCCGVFSDINDGIKICEDKNYFVGPAYLNQELYDEKFPWVGSFFPLDLK